MGLGHPGEFGAAELRMALQEFIPAIARLGCAHLATVLVGAGKDNLDISVAADIWFRALTAVAQAGLPHLACITFAQISPDRGMGVQGA